MRMVQAVHNLIYRVLWDTCELFSAVSIRCDSEIKGAFTEAARIIVNG